MNVCESVVIRSMMHLQFLVIVIEQRVPLVLLKQDEPDALDLRSIRAAVVALRHIHVVVAVLVLVVLRERFVGLGVLRLLVGSLAVGVD
jgi:hypothetical protein